MLKISRLAWLMIGLALLGLADASFLTASHWSGKTVACSITGSCSSVLDSNYAAIGSVPVALFGVVYYLSVLLLAGLYLDSEKDGMIKLAAWLTIAGLMASVYFVFIMAVVLKAYCQYCLFSAGTSTLLFVMGMIVLDTLKKVKQPTKVV